MGTHRNVVRRQSGVGSGTAVAPRLDRPDWSRGVGGARRTPRTRAGRRADSGFRSPRASHFAPPPSRAARHVRRLQLPVAGGVGRRGCHRRCENVLFPERVLSSAYVVATAGRLGPWSGLCGTPITMRLALAVPPNSRVMPDWADRRAPARIGPEFRLAGRFNGRAVATAGAINAGPGPRCAYAWPDRPAEMCLIRPIRRWSLQRCY
jgi:hypothetical protein